MRKKTAVPQTKEPYWYNEHIYFDDFYIKGELIQPGTLLKIKSDKTAWTFKRRVINNKLGTEWIELASPYGWKSVRPDRIMGTYIKKVTRRRKKSE